MHFIYAFTLIVHFHVSYKIDYFYLFKTNMHILVFDTETTGVPTNKWSNWSHCRLIQLAWIIVDEDYNIINEQSYIINDPSYSSSIEAFNTHHISEERRLQEGINANQVLSTFIKAASSCNLIVTHSNPFDIGVIHNECKLRNISLRSLHHIDVYDTQLCYEYISRKPTTLSACVYALNPEFKVPHDLQPHDALYDSYLCLELYILSETEQEGTVYDKISYIERCIKRNRY